MEIISRGSIRTARREGRRTGEERMTKRTGGKRGAPFGNRNRLKHGLYTRETLARDRKEAVERSHMRATGVLIGALLRVHNIELAMRQRKSPPPCGEVEIS